VTIAPYIHRPRLHLQPVTADQEPPVADEKPMRIMLTPEQQEQIKRMSGQQIDAIELEPADVKKGGGPLRFLWRLSAATGIPRLAWGDDDKAPPPGKGGTPEK
jgi:hypothetical protein